MSERDLHKDFRENARSALYSEGSSGSPGRALRCRILSLRHASRHPERNCERSWPRRRSIVGPRIRLAGLGNELYGISSGGMAELLRREAVLGEDDIQHSILNGASCIQTHQNYWSRNALSHPPFVQALGINGEVQ